MLILSFEFLFYWQMHKSLIGYFSSIKNSFDFLINSDINFPVPTYFSYTDYLPFKICRLGLYLGYALASINILLRILMRSLNYKAITVIIFSLAASIAAINLPALSFKIYQTNFSMHGRTLAAASWSILMSLICLPTIDKGDIFITRLTGFFGIIILIVFTITFETMFVYGF